MAAHRPRHDPLVELDEALPNTVSCERSAWGEEKPWVLEDSLACHRHGAAVQNDKHETRDANATGAIRQSEGSITSPLATKLHESEAHSLL
jgi:hypothetical protein